MSSESSRSHAHPALHWSNWNLLLLVPLLMLVTPVFNRDEPRLFGFPFFYWYQFLWVPVGVLCVAIVFAKTRHITGPVDRDEPVDGERR
ncbi:MAG: DUF3311 domain-containing protein [Actinomycetota bacterium]|nr:DUF3311 domain-containing protein [Actinomycetota bacterium]